VISICRQFKLPIHFIGVGEAIEDLQPFDANRFVEALF
jgi:fused signal recognition particle receptor